MAAKKTETKKQKTAETSAKSAKITAPISQAELKQLRTDYQKLKLDIRTGAEKDVTKLKNARQNIARALTLGVN